MDVEFFLSIFGPPIIFSFFYTLVFLKPSLKKGGSQIVIESSERYVSALRVVSLLGLSLILLSLALHQDVQANTAPAVFVLALLILGSLI